MEEDTGVKAPLTRLRRRLSLEQSDEVKSPSTPLTPTKRRGARLAAKPQLDLIEENAAAVSSPKTTVKTTAIVSVEPIGQKVSTPTRRSTRTKSISDVPEDTPSTPARRNIRIKSNTSIVSDSIVTDSPRARRAARRNSQVGSDNETTTVTPARKTRKTLKDSSSNIDNPVTAENGDKEQETIPEITANSRKSINNKSDSNSSPNISPRKSPRLQEKLSSKSNSKPEDEKEYNVQNTVNEVNTKSTLNVNESSLTQKIEDKDNTNREINESAKRNSEPILPKQQRSKILEEHFDKNLASLTKMQSYKTNRHRNNSWTIVSSTAASDNHYYSDNEEIKKKIKKKDKSFDLSKLSSYAVSKKANISLTDSKTDEGTLNISLKSTKNDESFKDVKNENVEQATNVELKTTDENTEVTQILHEVSEINVTSELLQISPGVVQSTILIEDSDSNTGSTNRLVMNLQENEDQCVPVIEHRLVNQTIIASLPSTENVVADKQNNTLLSFSSLNRSKDNLDNTKNADQNALNNDSCEPMDIDMTIPDNVLPGDAGNNLSSSIANVSKNDQSENSINKKSSTMQTLQVLEKSDNENKSTLVLSQIKDVTFNDDNLSETPKINEDTSMKSFDLNPNKKDAEETIKNNLSLNKITGTPLNQKHLLKHTMQTSTPVTTSPELNQIKMEENNTTNKELSHVETSNDTEANDEESSQKKFIFDQAEDAGDDYESGDSQDEEERQYINENEIRDKGETLSTEDDISNDDDYERDSFIVSSDEEDYELLSGSDENLTMSDNELTMSKKSKNKYNKRQEKKQKEASRQMFESRHKINTSESSETSKVKKSKTHKRQQIESSSSDSEEEEVVIKAGKKNRMRLDSSHDTSRVSDGSKTKKTNKLSESTNKSKINENEITNIFDESIMNKVDPLSYNEIKLEPKTPQKDLSLSTINFTVREEVEQVEIDENMTIIDKNDSLDPLLATIANNSIDDSSISENEQIKHDFDEVLSELNKRNKMTKLKEHDISLNLNKKSKRASGDPILDQLNITLTGNKSKNKLPKSKKTSIEFNKLEEKKNDTVVPIAADNESSTDSIDIRLLFPEDSNGSASSESKHKTSDDLIPLKKAESKTDIRVNMDISEDEVWKGWKVDTDDSDAPLEIPYVKHKNASNIYETNIEQNQDTKLLETEERGALNVSMNASVSAKKKQKKRISSNEGTFGIDVTKNDTSLVKTPKSAKKKEEAIISGENVDETTDIQLNTSNHKTPKSDKKKKRLSESNWNEDVKINKSLIKTPESKQKKKKLSESIGDEHGVGFFDDKIKKSFDKSLTKTPGSERKKPKLSESIGDKHDDKIDKSVNKILTKTPGSEQKKKKLPESIRDKHDDKIVKSPDKSLIKTLGSEQKKKKISESVGDKHDDNIGKSLDKSLTKTPGSEGKKKKSSTSISVEIDENNKIQGAACKKQKRKLSASINEEILQEQWNESLTTVDIKTKKRKKNKIVDTQSLDFKGLQDGVANGKASDSHMESEILLSKKAKIHRTVDDEQNKSSVNEPTKLTTHTVERSEQISAQNIKKDEKKRKQLTAESVKQERKTKAKRKIREDDDEEKQSKILKQHYFDKVHVPRLPAHILKDLDDKPNIEIKKKPPSVSTSQFTVEEIRKTKNKPSSYLEDSVYLNDLDALKKSKKQLKKPKVLPSVLTAAVSDCGSTTNFKVNVLPKDTKFVAQSTGIANYKNDYLYSGKIKRVGTYEQYKRQKNFKLSKF